MGNSRWRLETSINLALLNAKKIGLLDDIEIIVTDWGSEVPLSSVLSLINEAERRVKFINIPTKIAEKEQKDSKFPEVIALNVAARRATGDYIGRIDNDTIVGKEFFTKFKNCINNREKLWFDPEDVFMFVERCSIPFRISHKSFPLFYIENYLKWFGKKLKIETAREWGLPFWWSPVGIMIFHRKIWQDSRGYDEKLLYWGWMEGDLALRLGQKHHLIDFKDIVGNHLYHLEHYSNLIAYKDRNGPATPRKKNPPAFDNLKYTENNENWGLFNLDIKKNKFRMNDTIKYKSPVSYSFYERLVFIPKMLLAIFHHKIDNLVVSTDELLKVSKCKLRIKLGYINRTVREKFRH